MFSTWAGTFFCQPARYLQPSSLEEIQQIVNDARQQRKRLVTVGFGHSPSDITSTSSWMLNLDHYNRIIDIQGQVVSVQAGISLADLNNALAEHNLALANLGSINVQSIAGAISTGTHGSSLYHGSLGSNVRRLQIVLASGEAKWCSNTLNSDLFQAALVSLGALGVITQIELEVVAACRIEWKSELFSLDTVLDRWDSLWEPEFVRCWWLPYSKRMVVWSAEKTEKPCRPPSRSPPPVYHLYQLALWISTIFPSLTPAVEKLFMGLQHGFGIGPSNNGVDELRTGLLMDCLYSQNVNEWAIPLDDGPAAIREMEKLIEKVYAHAPIEVRVTRGKETGLLDHSMGRTLYINATLYRPYNKTPPWKDVYYEQFEQIMRSYGGRPHWAKNFLPQDFGAMYGDKLGKWLKIRQDVDPLGIFVGPWHCRNFGVTSCEQLEKTTPHRGGSFWHGRDN